jgi:hypothetical protein
VWNNIPERLKAMSPSFSFSREGRTNENNKNGNSFSRNHPASKFPNDSGERAASNA